MHVLCKLFHKLQTRILPQAPIFVLTPQYLRQVGLVQVIPIGTGSTHTCGYDSIRPIYPGKVRFGFIPEEWFEIFYAKTGKTGPYIFGFGLLNYLLSKEIYVCDHEFYTGLAMALLCILAVKRLGPKVADFTDKEIDKFESNWKKAQEDELKALQQMIDQEELEQWRAEGSLMLMQVKKDNIGLQVEAAYRKALIKVYEDVKRCLDYQVACRNVEHRISQKHRVDWLVKNVTEQLPKDLDVTELEKLKKDISAMALENK